MQSINALVFATWRKALAYGAIALLCVALLSCGSSSGVSETSPPAAPVVSPESAAAPSPVTLPPAVQAKILSQVAAEQSVPVADLSVVTATAQTWPNGCLGLGKPEEVCTQALVSGWRVVVTDGSQTWVYRSNETGDRLRQEATP